MSFILTLLLFLPQISGAAQGERFRDGPGGRLTRVNPSVDPTGMKREVANAIVMQTQPLKNKSEAKASCAEARRQVVEMLVKWSERCCEALDVITTGGKLEKTYASYKYKIDGNDKLQCENVPGNARIVTVTATCFNALFTSGCP